jgi:signal transduction histidine kinase
VVRRRLPRVRLGLRDRVTIAFGLMALALSTLLAVVTWVLVTHDLLGQRQAAARVEASANAQVLDTGLATRGLPVANVMDKLTSTAGSALLVTYQGRWYSTVLARDPSLLPGQLRSEVKAGSVAEQVTRVEDAKYLIVGIPLRGSGDALFELFPLADLDHTYHVLAITLVAVAAGTSLAGLMAGWYASRRAFRPLRKVTRAAEAFAQGDLEVRLEAEHDPDLAGLARSFNRTADAFAKRVAADARFAADVSHELRTPLTTLLNSAELLARRRAELPERLREPLDLLVSDLDRFRVLVIDLIEISRDYTFGEHETEPVSFADLAARAADAAAGRPVTVVEPGAERVRINADKRRLERVVTNLVQNAEHHGRGCVEARVAQEGELVRLTVDDAGPGIVERDRERVFERFARRDGSGAARGVGLGLAIVRQHVLWHGGIIRVEDRPGGGARFVVELPVRGSHHV